MKLIYLKITGNYRLMLNGLRSIELTPKSTIQLILGTNGSGKSSLLRETLPFAAESKDYEENGSKIVKYQFRNNEYTLTSTFNPNKHSFIKNNEELNQGGTQKVQNELVYQHFGLTIQIRDLLIGAKRFHSMSPQERRDWFTLMNPEDYSYAIEVYNKIKERSRDTLGALKIANARLSSELNKVVTEDEINKIKEEIKSYHCIISDLLSIRSPIDKSSDELKGELNQLKLRLDDVLKESFKIKAFISDDIKSEEDLISLISKLKEKQNSFKSEMNKLYENHKKLEKDINILKESGGSDVQSIKKQLDNKNEEIKSIKSSFSKKWEIDDKIISEAISIFNLIEDDLKEIFSTIEINDEGQYSKIKYQQLKEDSIKLKNTLTEQSKLLKRLEHEKEHYDHHRKSGEIICPKCNYSWINGFDEDKYKKIIRSIEEISSEFRNNEKSLESATQSLERTSEYFSIYRRYLQLKEKYPIIKSFWEACEENGISYKYPRMVLDVVSLFSNDIFKFRKIDNLLKEKDKLSSLLIALSSVDAVNIKHSELNLEEINKEIDNRTNSISNLQIKIDQLSSTLSDIRKLFKLDKWLKDKLIEADSIYKKTIDTLRMEDIHRFINEYQSNLSFKESSLKEIENKIIRINDLKSQIEGLVIESDSLKILLKTLSPTEGLIAEGMLGFINNFTDQMNQVISSIWSYPMEILPCNLMEDESLDLDYRFPMRVSQIPRVIPDIIAGSVGMREITDLAFKIVAMKYLGLQQFPLFLDEFGSGFDLAHRGSSIEAIRQLTSQLSFSQVWMVSHYESSYGALSDVDVCVLDSQNIVVPVNYNEHVVLE